MNVKKFAQDKAKKLKYDKFIKDNKQNLCSVDESKFKQFSVDLHKLSFDQGQINKKKNLFMNHDISVSIENQTSFNTRDQKNHEQVKIQNELERFIHKLESRNHNLHQVLEEQMEDEQQNMLVKRLISALYKKVNINKQQPVARHTCLCESSDQKSEWKTPSAKLCLLVSSNSLQEMQDQLTRLKTSKHEIEEIKKIDRLQKEYIRHTLESVYKRQLKQVQGLGIVGKKR